MTTVIAVLWALSLVVVGGFAWWFGFRDRRSIEQTVAVTFTLTDFDLWLRGHTRKNTRAHTTLAKLWANYRDWCLKRDAKPMTCREFLAKCREVFTVSDAGRAVGTQLIP